MDWTGILAASAAIFGAVFMFLHWNVFRKQLGVLQDQLVVFRNQLALLENQLLHSSLHSLHRELVAPGTQAALRAIYAVSPEQIKSKQDLELLDAAEHVLNLYDTIGYRLLAGTIPKQEVIDMEWPVILRIAQQLMPFVEAERKSRATHYKEGFAQLVELVTSDEEIRAEVMERNSGPNNDYTGLPTLPIHRRG